MDPDGNSSKERLNNYVAVSVAILAVFMAVTKVKDDNICQAMTKEKADEVNAWSYFQSKSVKQNLAELGRAQLISLACTTTGKARSQIEAEVKRYDEEIARYEHEKTEVRVKAEKHAKNYVTLNFRDDQFDLSDATLSIALGMLAVTALTGKRRLLVACWLTGGFGALLGLCGLVGIDFHPDWLIRFLS